MKRPFQIPVLLTIVFITMAVNALAQQQGIILIKSTPSGAGVQVDGIATGKTTPYQAVLNEGTYSYKLILKDYHDYTGTYSIKEDKTNTLNISLKPTFGSLNISSNPSGADVQINGNATGKTTPYQAVLDEGTYSYRLLLKDYYDYTGTYSIKGDETQTLNINLVPAFGSLHIISNPSGAQIEIDGTTIEQTTPATLTRLSSGKHLLTIKMEDYALATRDVEILDGKQSQLVIDLKVLFGKIGIATKPEADIYIDGTHVGTGFYAGSLMEGDHLVEAQRENYHTQQKAITMVKGEEARLSFELLPKMGKLAIITDPPELDIYIDGENMGKSPLIISQIIGEHRVEIKISGDRYIEKAIWIKEGGIQTINFDVNKIPEVKIAWSGYISFNRAKLVGDIIGSPKSLVTARGFCWNLTGHPTTADSSSANGSGTGSFSGDIAGLYEKTTYYVRAYAVNAEGTWYGNELNVNTPEAPVFVAGGTFQMGSKGYSKDERPVHRVTISSFYISKYEITHAQYIDFLNDIGCNANGSYNDASYGNVEYIDMDEADCAIDHNGSSFYFGESGSASTDNTPVIEVTWYGANAYCQWAGGRLPTEAEWEYAARGGNKSKGYRYSGSNTLGDVGRYDDNSYSRIHPVGGKQANELGIYDMSGNVWEWCSDWYGSNYYRNSPAANPQGPSSGSGKVLRGGSWGGVDSYSRVANRGGVNPAGGYSYFGFRLVKE